MNFSHMTIRLLNHHTEKHLIALSSQLLRKGYYRSPKKQKNMSCVSYQILL